MQIKVVPSNLQAAAGPIRNAAVEAGATAGRVKGRDGGTAALGSANAAAALKELCDAWSRALTNLGTDAESVAFATADAAATYTELDAALMPTLGPRH
jgi:uncharacterized protein YukE